MMSMAAADRPFFWFQTGVCRGDGAVCRSVCADSSAERRTISSSSTDCTSAAMLLLETMVSLFLGCSRSVHHDQQEGGQGIGGSMILDEPGASLFSSFKPANPHVTINCIRTTRPIVGASMTNVNYSFGWMTAMIIYFLHHQSKKKSFRRSEVEVVV
jgi:hypothetical protein